MRVTFITTIRHNVGDDFIREGIKHLLECHFGADIKYQYIHKHIPSTSRFGFSSLRSLKWSERIERFLPVTMLFDKIGRCDLLVQSGAPLYWVFSSTNCVRGNEWYQPLIKTRFRKRKSGRVWNIGVGTCQKYYSDGSEFFQPGAKEVCDFMAEFHDLSEITTVRDHLSSNLLEKLNKKAMVLACPSIFAINSLGITPQKPEYVVVNYMQGGGHFGFDEEIDSDSWEKNFLTFLDHLKEKEKVIAVCHNKKELEQIKGIAPEIDTFISDDYKDYLTFFSRAKFGFLNRVHAGFALSSFGRQSIIIGSDSRARMASVIGIDDVYVNNATPEFLASTYEKFIANTDDFEKSFEEIKVESRLEYLKLFKESEH